MHMRQSRWSLRRCEKVGLQAEARLATAVYTDLSAMGMHLDGWVPS